MADTLPESAEPIIICPNCGKPVFMPKMNVCYIARRECPSCAASILIEGDKVTAETPSTES